MIQIRECATADDYSLAMEITQAYINWLNVDLSFQDIDSELQTFGKMYGPPEGLYLLGFVKDGLAGGVGLRNLGNGVCEMKRLYVYDQYTEQGAGRSLCSELINQAKKLGYSRMRLDTFLRMKAARKLYTSLGFEEIEAYRFNPEPSTRYMELIL